MDAYCSPSILYWVSFSRESTLERCLYYKDLSNVQNLLLEFISLGDYIITAIWLPLMFKILGSIIKFLKPFLLPPETIASIPTSNVREGEDHARVSIFFSNHFHFNGLLTGIYMVCPPWA